MAGVVLHVKNIPCKVLEGSFRDAMREVGLDTTRYVLSFPKRSRPQGRLNNYGYGFVHCVCGEDAAAFAQAMHGFRFQDIDSSKQLVIEPGRNSAEDERARWAVGPAYAPSQVTVDAESSASVVAAMCTPASACREGMSFTEDDMTTTCRRGPSSVITSCSRQPDAFEVPPTRLGAWRLPANVVVDENDPLASESLGAILRFQ
eukprot:TRINITY_DN15696_c0_g2_i1.p1 TRINITY_DN15696_c0_g2~~TRINITY_DN15696_c0_g2_i1.p1  ORF type:complete len:203 (-),score=27.55 TRINITY_DN15696_c0_g2_i1:131-739(-)